MPNEAKTMNRKICLKLTLICAFLWIAPDLSARVYLTPEEALEIAFPHADAVERKLEIVLPDKKARIEELSHAGKVSRIFRYYAGIQNGAPVGYAVIADASGKNRSFTFLLVVGPTGSVKMVEILSYHDTHGMEVRQGWFREQYKGKTVADPIRLNEDIRNVSGATLSCRALTEGVRIALASLTIMVPLSPPLPNMGEALLDPLPDEETSEGVWEARERSGSPVLFRRAQFRMGTILEILVYATGQREADLALNRAFAEVVRLERLLARYTAVGERSNPDPYSGADSFRMDPEVIELLLSCKQLHRMTSGAFDVTVSPLVRLWKRAAQRNLVPTEEEVFSVRSRVGTQYVHIDVPKGMVQFQRKGVGIDLGGIGKGYALDRSAAILRANGIKAALLNFGGNIHAFGEPPGKGGWTVHIRDPRDPSKDLSVLQLLEGAVSTAGDYERHMEIQGNAYSHIIDPRTGRPVAGMSSVTVVAASATRADALSTGLYVLGPEGGRATALKHSLAAMFLSGDGEYRTSSFRALEHNAGRTR